MKKELPIGAEEFINVKKNDYYVEKTPLLMELAKAGDERVYLFALFGLLDGRSKIRQSLLYA